MNIRVIILLVLLLGPAMGIHAQTNSTSPYSRYGIGDLFTSFHGQFQGMGGSAIAIRTADHINFYNPASYTAFDSLSFIFETGIHSRLSKFESNLSSKTSGEMNFSYLAGGFKIKKWWSASFGLVPYSSVGYNIQQLGMILLPEGDWQNYKTYYTGAGGLNQVFIGQSFQFFNHLSLGINANYFFGSIDHTRIVNFLEPDGSSSSGYFNTKYSNKYIVSDFSYELGAQYYHVFKKSYKLTLGATYMHDNQLDAFLNEYIEKSNTAGLVDTLLNLDHTDGSIDLPRKLGLGMSFTTDKLILTADYQQQNWSQALFLGNQDSLSDSRRYSLGAELIPNPRNILNMWSRARYRIGGYYSETYLTLNGNQLTDYGISFGIGIPVSRSKSIINLNVVLGSKGTLDSNLIRENYGLLSLSLSLHDIWFLKRKFD